MFLDETSVSTSILIYAGLGFVFFLGFGYYLFRNPVKKGNSFFFNTILGCIRGLILASLFIAIFPFKILENPNLKEPVEFIFVVDFPELMLKDFDQTFRKADSIVKIKHPDLIWIDFSGRAVMNFKKPLSVSHSLYRLNQTLRKFYKGHSNKEIYILTDGNLNDLNIELASNIHIIPYGRISNKEQIEFSTANLPIFSVPAEEVHLPIEIWLKNFRQNKNVIINIYVDGVFLNKQKISFDNDHTFLIADVKLKSDQLGKHQIKVSLDNGLKTFIDWNVVREKAVVYGFSDDLNPDVGVLNRVAKNKFIKLIWNFDVNTKISNDADKFIFMRILPNETFKSRILKSSVLFLNNSIDKVELYLDHITRDQHLKINGESLWDSQMKEFQIHDSYAQTDSLIGSWFDDLYINHASKLDSFKKDRAWVDDLLIHEISNNSLGRNETKLNFLDNKNKIDLLEIGELEKADFVRQGPNSNLKGESIYIWQNVYFKLWVLLLIMVEWLLRKFKELR